MKKLLILCVLSSFLSITVIHAQNISNINNVSATVSAQIKTLSGKLVGLPQNITRLQSIIVNFETARIQEIKNSDNLPATISKINTAYLAQKVHAVQNTLPASFLKNLTSKDLETIFK
jgi:hypothetical protein